MKILYGGPLSPWNTTEARRRALVTLGHDLRAVNVNRFIDPGPRLVPKLKRHLQIGSGIAAYNRELLDVAEVWKPNLVWLDLPSQVWPKTVRALRSKGTMVVNHNSEYVGYQRYWFRHLLAAADQYDAHIVTNELTADALKRLGAARVITCQFSYDPDLHRPIALTPEEAKLHEADAVFVGHWEPRTGRLVARLRRNGLTVKVHGPNWQRAYQLSDRRAIQPIYGQDYVKALTGAKICLCFLSGWNRNQATLRTFEIPAVGGLLLADRTPLHESYFEEGKEAEFFSSVEELVEKCRRYSTDDKARMSVARAGRERCSRGNHTHTDEVGRIISELFPQVENLRTE
jgi:spore maturation protein CgeB